MLLAGVNWDITNICTSGDPGDITLTLTDYADALDAQDVIRSVPAIYKFHQWIAHAMFSQWCNCADGTSPPAPTVSVPPPYQPNPGTPSGAPTGPCWDVTQVLGHTTEIYGHWLDKLMLPQTPYITTQQNITNGPTSSPQIPAGVTSVHTHAVLTQPSGQDACAIELDFFNASGTFLSRVLPYENTLQLGLDQTNTFPVPATTAAWNMLYSLGNPVSDHLTFEFQFNCSGTGPLVLNTPCCPPDPSVDIRLRSIQDMLQFLMDQTKPRYTPGTVHTGITGSGTLAISNLVGVHVDITSGVPTNPQLPGVPPYEFSVGWMSVSEPNGMLDEKRITRQHQVWLSGVTPYATVFGYYLNPGFTINVTELIPA